MTILVVPTTQILVLKCYFLFKKIKGHPGETADSRSAAGNIQDKPGISCHIRQQGSYQRP